MNTTIRIWTLNNILHELPKNSPTGYSKFAQEFKSSYDTVIAQCAWPQATAQCAWSLCIAHPSGNAANGVEVRPLAVATYLQLTIFRVNYV